MAAGIAMALPNNAVNYAKVSDEHRNRIELIPGVKPEVREVNRLLDARGIPLSATLADLFILQSVVKPTPGSALDVAFENKIIEKFQEELDRGMSPQDIKKEIEQNLTKSTDRDNLKKIIEEIEYNQAGVYAHTSFAAAKLFAFRLAHGFNNPGIIHKERLDINYKDSYPEELEKYSKQIDQALIRIENKLSETQRIGKSETDLNEVRNKYVLEEVEAFKNPKQENINTTQRFREALATEKKLKSDDDEQNINPTHKYTT